MVIPQELLPLHGDTALADLGFWQANMLAIINADALDHSGFAHVGLLDKINRRSVIHGWGIRASRNQHTSRLHRA